MSCRVPVSGGISLILPDPAEENSVTIVDPQPEFFRIRLQYNAEPDPVPSQFGSESRNRD